MLKFYTLLEQRGSLLEQYRSQINNTKYKALQETFYFWKQNIFSCGNQSQNALSEDLNEIPESSYF